MPVITNVKEFLIERMDWAMNYGGSAIDPKFIYGVERTCQDLLMKIDAWEKAEELTTKQVSS